MMDGVSHLGKGHGVVNYSLNCSFSRGDTVYKLSHEYGTTHKTDKTLSV